ncbi:MAG TPA: NADH-quinone oxidoreductase subunit N [Acidimicrobiia bacterium]|nr:NADH-quinone oxidoreductase subunit N [Acidimicrobiia bacterium]
MPAPYFDYAALAPELILTAAIVVVLVADLLFEEREKYRTSTLAGLGCLAALVPVLYLAGNGADRTMFGGAYMVDNYALLMKALFLVAGYITILLSANYIDEGDYYQGEYYVLLLTALLGMTVMASARDLVTIFVALETLSIPTYLLAGWRKHDARSNESSLKYYLMGVLSSAVMLYGMSIVYGMAGDTRLVQISRYVEVGSGGHLFDVAIFFTLVGFAFKVSAVPFHFWAPDSYEGAPTPVTAFLSVASKTGGFVALLSLIYVGFFGRADAWQPILWVLAAASMTVGNLIALKQTNLVRMLAYSSIAQGGFMLVPFAVANQGDGSARPAAFSATVVYLLIYAVMNLGAFAALIAIARKTRSADIDSYSGLFNYAPALAVTMSLFLFSLAGIPPLGGWYAKLVVFKAVLDAGTKQAVILGVVAAVNSVIALFYYARVAGNMWFRPAPADGGGTARVPVALGAAIALPTALILAIGVYPNLFARLGELATKGL